MCEVEQANESAEISHWLRLKVSSLTSVDSETIPDNKSFSDLGLSSLGFLILIRDLDKQHGIALKIVDAYKYENIAALTEHITGQDTFRSGMTNSPDNENSLAGHEDFHTETAQDKTSPDNKQNYLRDVNSNSAALISLNPEGSRIPLFWVYGGAFFSSLKTHIPGDQPVHIFPHQGTYGHDVKYRTIREIAEFNVRTIMAVCSDQDSVYLAGYSIGGLVAYEMAQLLSREKITVAKLILVSPKAPPSLTKSQLHEKNSVNKPGYPARKIRHIFRYISPPRIIRKGSRICRSAWMGYAMRKGKLPPSLLWEYLQPMYYKAARSYDIKPYRGNALLIGEEEFNPAPWVSLIEGHCTVAPLLDCQHLELSKQPFTSQWVPHFLEALD